MQRVQRRGRCLVSSSWVAWASLAAVALLAAPPGGDCLTLPTDKQALLEIEKAFTETHGYLNWSPDTDPCLDAWAGVTCTCEGAMPPLNNCNPAVAARSPQRVLQIGIYRMTASTQKPIVGVFSPWIGNLTALRVVSLPGQRFSGLLPDTMNKLGLLEIVDLSSNNIAGVLPSWAGALPYGQVVRLDQNRFTGPIPAAWCPSNESNLTYNITINGNPGLCDAIPQCIASRIEDVSDTALISPSNGLGSSGRLCATNVTICQDTNGCGIYINQYNTNVSSIYFNFTEFAPTNGTSGEVAIGRVQYFWGLGTQPGLDDVLAGNRVDTDINFTTTTQDPLTGQDYTQRLYPVSQTLPGVAFINGQRYYAVVTASSIDDTSLVSNLTSQPTLTDTDPPFLPPGSVIDNTADYQIVQSQDDTDQMGASWDDFLDPQSGIAYYQYQIRQEVSDRPGAGQKTIYNNITDLIYVGLETSGVAKNISLTPGDRYVVLVNATNNAGLTAYAQSPTLLINKPTRVVTSSSAAIIAAACIGVCSVLVALITVFIVRSRYNARRQVRREQRRQMKELKSLMYGLVSSDSGGDPMQKRMDRLAHSRQLCFVMTDLESSTAQANADPDAFLQVQDIHDTVMREGIAKHGGYEINTEGDAFQVAFTTVHQAVLFSMETQYRLLESAWPRDVLKLPSCREVLAPDGSILFRGPRVRMGVHWAAEGMVAQRLHVLTKHRVFSGPAFLMAQEVGDVAHGGQVALTHDAWLELRHSMDQAGFPTIEQLGLYKLESWPTPVWLYQVTHLLGKPLLRTFDPLRKTVQLSPGWGLNIVPPPQPHRLFGPLTFCAMRCALDERKLHAANEDMALELPAPVSRKLYEIIAVNAMQFGGYIFKVNEGQGRFMLVFASTLDAVRCCHAVQAHILYTPWPAEALVFSGPTEHMPDGRLIFRGPRMATAIHETVEYTVDEVDEINMLEDQQDEDSPALDSRSASPTGDPAAVQGGLSDRLDSGAAAIEASIQKVHRPVEYGGGGEAFVRHVATAIYGGQVVLTESAWTTVQDHIPGQAQVISLGAHVIEVDQSAFRMLLMEVMPSVLARRAFPPPRTAAQLEPGYRDSPDPAENLAILFLKTSKPLEVQQAEQAAGTLADDLVISTITEYNLGVAMVSRTVRQLLPAYNGYECKEPEAAKFTLAFRSLEEAVRWAVGLQEALLEQPWPETVLSWEQAAEVPSGGARPLWRGLRVRIGIAWGGATYRKPLNTGRADYFGNLPNLAARVSALAAPGQILLEGTGLGLDEMSLPAREEAVVVLPALAGVPEGATAETGRESARGLYSVTQTAPSGSLPTFGASGASFAAAGGEGAVQLKCLGHFRLKGLKEPKVIWQAMPQRLAARHFALPPEHMAERLGTLADAARQHRRRGATSPSVTASLDSSSQLQRIPKSIIDVVRNVRFTKGWVSPGGAGSSTATGPPTGSGDSCDTWPGGPRPGSRPGSITALRQDSNPSGQSSENGGEHPMRSASGRALRSGLGPATLDRRGSGGSLSGAVAERCVSWSDGQTGGLPTNDSNGGGGGPPSRTSSRGPSRQNSRSARLGSRSMHFNEADTDEPVTVTCMPRGGRITSALRSSIRRNSGGRTEKFTSGSGGVATPFVAEAMMRRATRSNPRDMSRSPAADPTSPAASPDGSSPPGPPLPAASGSGMSWFTQSWDGLRGSSVEDRPSGGTDEASSAPRRTPPRDSSDFGDAARMQPFVRSPSVQDTPDVPLEKCRTLGSSFLGARSPTGGQGGSSPTSSPFAGPSQQRGGPQRARSSGGLEAQPRRTIGFDSATPPRAASSSSEMSPAPSLPSSSASHPAPLANSQSSPHLGNGSGSAPPPASSAAAAAALKEAESGDKGGLRTGSSGSSTLTGRTISDFAGRGSSSSYLPPAGGGLNSRQGSSAPDPTDGMVGRFDSASGRLAREVAEMYANRGSANYDPASRHRSGNGHRTEATRSGGMGGGIATRDAASRTGPVGPAPTDSGHLTSEELAALRASSAAAFAQAASGNNSGRSYRRSTNH